MLSMLDIAILMEHMSIKTSTKSVKESTQKLMKVSSSVKIFSLLPSYGIAFMTPTRFVVLASVL